VRVTTMSNLLIRLVELGPLRVAYTHVFSKTPEQDAWNKLKAWAVSKGFLDNLQSTSTLATIILLHRILVRPAEPTATR